MRKMFSACGPHVRKITMRKVLQEEELPKAFMQLFTMYVFLYCRNVREIVFCEYRAPLTKWGAAFSLFRDYAANLRKIEWHGEEDMNGFPHLRKCVHLRCLKSRGLNTVTLVSLLEVCGPTLQELDISITPVVDSVEVVDAIRKYCKQLSVILINDRKHVLDVVGEERYSSLLCSFGWQLKNADTSGLGREHLVKVVNACPILEVSAVWNGIGNGTAQRFCDLGPRVVLLFLIGDLSQRTEYVRALKQCSNLRRLCIGHSYGNESPEVTDEVIANPFSPSRFPKLEELIMNAFRANDRNMRSIASCAPHLKCVVLEPCKSNWEISAFRILADSSRRLKQIIITINGFQEIRPNAESALESLSELMKVFRKCQKFRFIVSCLDDVELKEDLIRTCRVLPCRGVHVCVEIGDVIYRYP